MENPGKPPKEAAEIRARLKSVLSGNPPREVGSRSEGLASDEPLLITSFVSGEVCKGFQRALSAAGIPSQIVHKQRRYHVHVDAEDRNRAYQILEDYAREHADTKPAAILTDYDYLFFGAMLGGVVGTVLILTAYQGPLDFARILLFAFIGGMCGHLLDRIQARCLRRGMFFAIGLWEFLILMALPAFLLFLYRVTPQLIGR